MVVERKFIEDLMIKHNISKYLERRLSKAGYSRVDIQKTPIITRITTYVTNPGRVIGRGGETIDALTEDMKKKFSIENPQISVTEVRNQKLEPRLVAKYVANSLERGVNARRLLHSVIRDIMNNGALGAEIVAQGKLAAKGAKAKSIKVRLGYLPKAGDVVKLIDEAKVASYPKYGAIGIQVRIVQPGTKFPDRQVKKIELPKSIAAASIGHPNQ
ncbi:MAG: 30S ribosomal protein S3 [Candidatus Micrarchaeota archaeon]|nr:30S ribosomal protein S3 [Candidatus Micrarchaeota archaeon]MDE1849477.1 30S ribosomal protein S3 [Candidatus Micrarchaeota archaeon]